MKLPAEEAEAETAVAAPATGTSARVAAVLEALVRTSEAGTGARELGASLLISRSSVQRILQVMADLRVARVGRSGRYEPGARLLAWAGFLDTRHPVLQLGSEILTRLAGQAEESALLVSYAWPDHSGVTVAMRESARPIRYKVEVGSPTPLQVGSAGKAILAHLPAGWGRGGDQPPLTAATMPGTAELQAQLVEVRRLGYAVTVGERTPEAAGAASAYFRDGAVAGAVNLTVPRHRVDEAQLHAHGAQVQAAAALLTEQLQVLDAHSSVGAPPATALDTELAASADLYDSWIKASSGFGQAVDGRAVARAIGVLDALARCPIGGASSEQLAASLGTSAMTVGRVLQEFARRRLARRLHTGRWEAGQQLLALPGIVGTDPTITRLSRDILAELVSVSGETVCVVRYDSSDGSAVFEAVHESPKPFRHAPPAGSRAPLHAGAAGKAILAYLHPSVVQAQELVRFTDATTVDRASLDRELALTRQRGYAVSGGEHIPEAVGVAAVIFRDREVAGSLDITIPNHRCSPELLPALGAHVAAAAREVTRLLSRTGGTTA